MVWMWKKRHSGKLAALQDAVRAPTLATRRATRSISTITEVCNSDSVPEVEIVSLLQEHIPKYRLRADSLTQFGGYENQDWFIPSPALKLGPEDLALSPDQIRETLNYFLLCSNRVSQMTKTYNDIEAVTRLLEEKEKDLELTARIGKELLAANGRLEARVSALEGELRSARDHVTQLRHELSSKSDLLQVLTNDTEECEWEVGEGGNAAACAEAMARRTGALERENRALREEASRLAAGADMAEDAERNLLRDIANQLASANAEANSMGTELMSERERCAELQQQLQFTSTRLHASERSLAQLTAEHEHAMQILEITRENQNALAAELADSKERYAEVMAHLVDAQDQLRALRKRGEAAARSGGLMPSVAAAAGLMPNSLHHELHSSIYSDLSLDSGISDPMAMSSVKKAFETVQCATRWSTGSGSVTSSVSDGVDSVDAPRAPRKPMSLHSTDSFMDNISEADSEEFYPGGTGGTGVPGVPGAAELAAALKRLTPAEIHSRRATLHAAHAMRYRKSDSEESAVWGAGGVGRWRLPSKLQIVKPMEGSHTLHTWAQLAKPNMSGLLDEHEGVGVRGGRSAAALGLELYRLSDVEEDEDLLRMPHASHVYTLTDSMVMHPNDGSLAGSLAGSTTNSAMSSASTSVLGSAWSSRRTSRHSSAAVSPTRTPLVLSRRDSFCSTPARIHWSPTATPANSPLLGSPEASPPPSPLPGQAPSLHSLISSGTSILRRTFLSPAVDGQAHSPMAMQTPGSLYTGLVHRSPMEQLTCLKRALHSPSARSHVTLERRESMNEPLGVPGAPGSGALETLGRPRGGRNGRTQRPRTDLGTVGTAPPPATAAHSSPLGTLSTLLFGRKGGLL